MKVVDAWYKSFTNILELWTALRRERDSKVRKNARFGQYENSVRMPVA